MQDAAQHRSSHTRRAAFFVTATRLGLLFLLGLAALAASCANGAAEKREGLQLRTTAFNNGGNIPRKYTCDGENVSPSLAWTTPPTGTESFALIADDPDAPAGTWVHWVVYDLPVSRRELPEAQPQTERLPGGGRQGRNDFPQVGYGGPCPPPGKPHRYFFKLYALDTRLDLDTPPTKAQVDRAMKGHIQAEAEVMGRYGR